MGRARILAVDDQRYFRELVEGLLEDEGYEVTTAASGEEALHVLEREDFEVVLTDLVMPGLDGAELVRRVKERRPDQDIVMVTGVVDVKAAVEAMKLGATDYILKPFDRALLLDSVDKILGRRRLREEHARLLQENLEFMGVLSLFERAAALFSTLAVEPLAERIVEGLCLETRAQTGLLWVADEADQDPLRLVGARGLVRVEDEPESIRAGEALGRWCPSLGEEAGTTAGLAPTGSGEELFVVLRAGGGLLGIVRLSDRLHGEPFDESDRAMAEKFCEFGATALHNALRFRSLEQRSLRDPETRAYTERYFEDAVRNEIQKGHRFGHRFSILRVLPPAPEGDGTGTSRGGARARSGAESPVPGGRGVLRRRVETIEGVLRSTDLIAAGADGRCTVLLPQTDALGAGILGQRIRQALRAVDGPGADATLGSATFPVDGRQIESLERVLDERVEAARTGLLAMRPDLSGPPGLEPFFDRMLELGSVEPVEVEGQILRFVLEDVARRPADRALLFLSPGTRWLPDVLDVLHDTGGRATRTQIVVLAEGEEPDLGMHVTWVSKSALDSRRPFLVYFGDGPAFAMIGAVSITSARAPVFQTADRPLVETLTFELQRELSIPLTV